MYDLKRAASGTFRRTSRWNCLTDNWRNLPLVKEDDRILRYFRSSKECKRTRNQEGVSICGCFVNLHINLASAVRIIKRKRLSNLLCLPVSVQLSKEPDRSLFLFFLKDRVICFFVLKDGYINLKCSLNKLNSFLLVVLTEILTFSLTVCLSNIALYLAQFAAVFRCSHTLKQFL